MSEQRLKRCPKGTFRNKSSGLCQPKNSDVVVSTRCPNGSYRNKVTGLCEPKRKSPLSSPKQKSPVRRTKCPKGTHRNKITGLCEPKRKSHVLSPKRKSPLISPKRKSPLSSPKRKSSVLPNKRFIRDDNYVLTPKLINFYKQNATPIRQDSDIHPGSFEFSKIAFKYLSNRYDNLLYLNDSGENLTLCFYVIKDPRIYEGRYHMSLRNNNQTKEYIIYDFLDDAIYTKDDLFYLIDGIQKVIAENKNKRFFAMRVNLQSFSDAHANIIIYDTKKNTLELFDPHGSKTMDKFEPMKVRHVLNVIFKKISPHIEFLQSYEINPYIGLQTIQGGSEYLRQPDEVLGYCGAWTFFYLQMRIANPELSQMSLIKQIKGEIINKGNFFNMMRNYVKYIIENGYRHKYNIKPRKLKL